MREIRGMRQEPMIAEGTLVKTPDNNIYIRIKTMRKSCNSRLM